MISVCVKAWFHFVLESNFILFVSSLRMTMPMRLIFVNPSFSFFSDVDVESTPPTTASSTASDIRPILPPRQYENNSNSNNIPMPTLYNGSSDQSGGHHDKGGNSTRQPRMGTIEVLLYNMASMLAGVAVGYDVRLSNVSPIHPKLYPKR